MRDGVVDAAADDTEVQQDRHTQFLRLLVEREVVGAIVVAQHADHLQADVAHVVQFDEPLRRRRLRIDHCRRDPEILVALRVLHRVLVRDAPSSATQEVGLGDPCGDRLLVQVLDERLVGSSSGFSQLRGKCM